MSRLKEIREYFKENCMSDEVFGSYTCSSVGLCLLLIRYVHKDQIRVDGSKYEEHPKSVFERYRKAILKNEEDDYRIDKSLMIDLKLPYKGIEEICLLHDVIEDTDFTLVDIEEIFKDCGFYDRFESFIKNPLRLISHNKNDDYETYINKCMEASSASLVKLFDLLDNSDFTTLSKFGSYECNRCKKYLKYAYKINKKYHFVENLSYYRKHRDVIDYDSIYDMIPSIFED